MVFGAHADDVEPITGGKNEEILLYQCSSYRFAS
jgi:hypothetical protein